MTGDHHTQDEVDEERQALLNPPPKPLQINPTDTGLVTSWPTQYDQQSTSRSEEQRKKEKARPQTAVNSQEEAQAGAPDSSSSSEDEALQIEVQTQSSLDLFRKVLPGHAQGSQLRLSGWTGLLRCMIPALMQNIEAVRSWPSATEIRPSSFISLNLRSR
jgi:hypothetical protein